MEGVDYLFGLLIMVPIMFLVIGLSAMFDPGVTHEYTGHIVDVQYSSGACGHDDMTIVIRVVGFLSRARRSRNHETGDEEHYLQDTGLLQSCKVQGFLL